MIPTRSHCEGVTPEHYDLNHVLGEDNKHIQSCKDVSPEQQHPNSRKLLQEARSEASTSDYLFIREDSVDVLGEDKNKAMPLEQRHLNNDELLQEVSSEASTNPFHLDIQTSSSIDLFSINDGCSENNHNDDDDSTTTTLESRDRSNTYDNLKNPFHKEIFDKYLEQFESSGDLLSDLTVSPSPSLSSSPGDNDDNRLVLDGNGSLKDLDFMDGLNGATGSQINQDQIDAKLDLTLSCESDDSNVVIDDTANILEVNPQKNTNCGGSLQPGLGLEGNASVGDKEVVDLEVLSKDNEKTPAAVNNSNMSQRMSLKDNLKSDEEDESEDESEDDDIIEFFFTNTQKPYLKSLYSNTDILSQQSRVKEFDQFNQSQPSTQSQSEKTCPLIHQSPAIDYGTSQSESTSDKFDLSILREVKVLTEDNKLHLTPIATSVNDSMAISPNTEASKHIVANTIDACIKQQLFRDDNADTFTDIVVVTNCIRITDRGPQTSSVIANTSDHNLLTWQDTSDQKLQSLSAINHQESFSNENIVNPDSKNTSSMRKLQNPLANAADRNLLVWQNTVDQGLQSPLICNDRQSFCNVNLDNRGASNPSSMEKQQIPPLSNAAAKSNAVNDSSNKSTSDETNDNKLQNEKMAFCANSGEILKESFSFVNDYLKSKGLRNRKMQTQQNIEGLSSDPDTLEKSSKNEEDEESTSYDDVGRYDTISRFPKDLDDIESLPTELRIDKNNNNNNKNTEILETTIRKDYHLLSESTFSKEDYDGHDGNDEMRQCAGYSTPFTRPVSYSKILS